MGAAEANSCRLKAWRPYAHTGVMRRGDDDDDEMMMMYVNYGAPQNSDRNRWQCLSFQEKGEEGSLVIEDYDWQPH